MICIDPGLRGVGLAVFDEDNLVHAQYVTNPSKGRGYAAHVALAAALKRTCLDYGLWSPALVEHPAIYPGMPQVDLNDLLDVVAVGAACSTIFASVTTVMPSEWKGNMPKRKMLERIRSKLTPEEVARVEWTNKSDNEDVLDAIGIGLWKLGRLNSKVYPGATT